MVPPISSNFSARELVKRVWTVFDVFGVESVGSVVRFAALMISGASPHEGILANSDLCDHQMQTKAVGSCPIPLLP